MKAIILDVLFTIFWLVIGHFFGIFSHFFSFAFFPILFLISAYQIKYSLSGIIVIPFCFLIILSNDFLFRIYGGGIHDDAGRGLCEMIFYITFLTSIVTMLFIANKLANNNKVKWLYNTLLVLSSAVVSYLVFIKFSVKI